MQMTALGFDSPASRRRLKVSVCVAVLAHASALCLAAGPATRSIATPAVAETVWVEVAPLSPAEVPEAPGRDSPGPNHVALPDQAVSATRVVRPKEASVLPRPTPAPLASAAPPAEEVPEPEGPGMIPADADAARDASDAPWVSTSGPGRAALGSAQAPAGLPGAGGSRLGGGARLLAGGDPCPGYFPAGSPAAKGAVKLVVEVDARGAVRASEVVAVSPGNAGFAEAAQACSQRLRFAAATNEVGVAVASRAKLLLRFERP